MKQGTLATKCTILVLFLGILAYLVFSFTRGLHGGYQTEPVYKYAVDWGITASGLLVREEEPIYTEAQLVEVLPGEGRRVGNGQVVARVYQSAADLARVQEKERIAMQLEQLSYFGATEKLTADTVTLEREIAAAIPSLRAAAAAKELSALPEAAQSLKLLLSLRSYAFNGTRDAEELTASLRERLDALEAAGAGGTTYLRVEKGGVFSALVDGFEPLLTPEGVMLLTPSDFAQIFAVTPTQPKNAVGKLIYGSRWYFAALLTEEEGSHLTPGQTVPLRFLRGGVGVMNLRVDRVSEAEDGSVLAVFSADRYLADTTLLRRQNAELVLETYSGLYVSKRALRVLEDGSPGVYCVVGALAKFKPVRILYEGVDYYLVESDPGQANALLAGDEVIVSGSSLYDGKVIRGG